MRWIFGYIYVRAFSRQTTSLMLLLTVMGALLPVPLFPSVAGIAKDRSQAFPCQDRPCGCLSAEQCRKKCCCYSKEQKIAWAKRNGVEVSVVVAQNLAQQHEDSKVATTKRSCCKNAGSSTSVAKPLVTARQTTKARTQAMSRGKIVVGVIAQECQGVAMTLIGLPMFVLPANASLETPTESLCQRLTLVGSRLVPCYTEPPVPPPRQFAI